MELVAERGCCGAAAGGMKRPEGPRHPMDHPDSIVWGSDRSGGLHLGEEEGGPPRDSQEDFEPVVIPLAEPQDLHQRPLWADGL
jgi:hypothetical protein